VFKNGPGFEEAFPIFAPDTVMITAGDISISWEQLFIFLFPVVNDIYQRHEGEGGEFGWNDQSHDHRTWREYALESALGDAKILMSYMYGIKDNNIVLSDDDLMRLDDSIDSIIAVYGSIEEFEEILRENDGYNSFDLFMNIITTEFSISVLIDKLYGDEGSNFPDAGVLEFVERHDFLMAMHILRLKPGF